MHVNIKYYKNKEVFTRSLALFPTFLCVKLFYFISRVMNASEFSSMANVGLVKMRVITTTSMESRTSAGARGTSTNSTTIPNADHALDQSAESSPTSFTK